MGTCTNQWDIYKGNNFNLKFNKETFIFLSLSWYTPLFDSAMVCIDSWKLVDIRFYWHYIVFIPSWFTVNGLLLSILFIKWISWAVIFTANSVDFHDDEIHIHDIKVHTHNSKIDARKWDYNSSSLLTPITSHTTHL